MNYYNEIKEKLIYSEKQVVDVLILNPISR